MNGKNIRFFNKKEINEYKYRKDLSISKRNNFLIQNHSNKKVYNTKSSAVKHQYKDFVYENSNSKMFSNSQFRTLIKSVNFSEKYQGHYDTLTKDKCYKISNPKRSTVKDFVNSSNMEKTSFENYERSGRNKPKCSIDNYLVDSDNWIVKDSISDLENDNGKVPIKTKYSKGNESTIKDYCSESLSNGVSKHNLKKFASYQTVRKIAKHNLTEFLDLSVNFGPTLIISESNIILPNWIFC